MPGLESKKNSFLPLCYAFLRFCGNADSSYWKGQLDGQRCGGMWLEEVEMDSCLEERPKGFSSTGKGTFGNTNTSFYSHKCQHVECMKL